MINLDHNATTPIHPEVVQAITACWETTPGNPASSHRLGRQARQALESAREGVAQLVGAEVERLEADTVVFTSGGTEANNLALFGLAGKPPGNVIVSAIEHPSVMAAAEALARRGFHVQKLPATANGQIDAGQLDRLLTRDTRLVSVMLANNETGVVQPIDQVAEVCRQHRVPLHTDAVQAVGKIPVHFRDLNVAALSFSAHKFHGPRGIGALVIRHGVTIDPILFGGFQQAGLRPGTQPVELAVGLHRALQLWKRDASLRSSRMAALRDHFEELLRAANCGVVINGLTSFRLPNTSSVAFPGLDCQAIHMALDLADVACSIGAACASGAAEPSPVLLAMGIPPNLVNGAVRFSLGAFTTREEIEWAAARVVQCVSRMHG